MLLSIAGGTSLGLFEVNEAAGIVSDAVSQDVNLIFGTVIDENLGDTVRVTVIATGFGGDAKAANQSKLDLGAERRPSFLNNTPAGGSSRPAAPASQPASSEFDIPDFLKRSRF